MNQQEKIRTILKEEYEREYILYRAVGLDEAIKSCEAGHLVYYSRDPMSRDWEVIEYGLGDAASEMSDDEVDEYVNNLVPWVPNRKGVNLTSDLDNAKGYSDIVLEINLVGYDYAEFSDVHIFAKNPDDCKIKSVYYNGEEYSKEGFLDITKSLQESIRRILREEVNNLLNRLKPYLIEGKYLYHYTPTYNLNDIKEEGLTPRKNPNSFYKNGIKGVFLTNKTSLYGANLPQDLMDLMDEYYENEEGEKPIVRLTIDVTQLNPNKITWDDDYIMNQYKFNKANVDKDKIIESIDIWGTITYKGIIPPEFIINEDFDYQP